MHEEKDSQEDKRRPSLIHEIGLCIGGHCKDIQAALARAALYWRFPKVFMHMPLRPRKHWSERNNPERTLVKGLPAGRNWRVDWFNVMLRSSIDLASD